ncbi:MAG TPA: lipopolysaccharide assembly protein LapA domain-containing protein [Solirubrobacteraceae bacterium]|nr:lipopolysaccharide assembly protein LapA domain-containing protein [Solirubrobacteraceae bacterium]
MSASAPTPGDPQAPAAHGRAGRGGLDKRSRRELLRTGSLVVLAILVTLFAVFNLDEVKVSYVFGSGKAPLIIVIVISVLVGIVLAYIAERVPRKRRR